MIQTPSVFSVSASSPLGQATANRQQKPIYKQSRAHYPGEASPPTPASLLTARPLVWSTDSSLGSPLTALLLWHPGPRAQPFCHSGLSSHPISTQRFTPQTSQNFSDQIIQRDHSHHFIFLFLTSQFNELESEGQYK